MDHVVYCSNEKYLMPTMASAHSVLRHWRNGKPPPITIVVDGCLNAMACAKRVRRVVKNASRYGEIRLMDYAFANRNDYVSNREEVPSTTYIRVLLPEILGLSAGRLLYIDGDILALGDISELRSVDFATTLAAVLETQTPTLGETLDYCLEDLALDPAAPYFNAGMLLIDVGRFRSADGPTKVREFSLRYGKQMRQADQDALNAVFADDWTMLPERWNRYAGRLSDSAREAQRSPEEPALLHYSGLIKPWIHGFQPGFIAPFCLEIARSGWFAPLEFPVWWVRRSMEYLRWRRSVRC